MVYEALGAPTPTFAHISMILGTDGKKLSKRHGATSVEEYRDQGFLSDAFVNYLALLGWSLDGETTIIPRDVLASRFSLDHVSKNPAIMDPEKLAWVQQQYIMAMTDEQFSDEVLIPELHAHDLEPVGECLHDAAWYDLLSSVLKPRVTLPSDIFDQVLYLYTDDDELELDEKAVAKWLGKAGAADALTAAREALAAIPDDGWEPAAIEAALEPLPEKLGMGKGKVFQPIRVAVVGGAASPGIGETLALAGKEHVLARIDRAKALCA